MPQMSSGVDTAECVLLPPSTGCYGYVRIRRDGKLRLAHRWFYEQERGSIPEGMDLDHLCRNRNCVNSGHLEPVPHAVNVQRGRLAKLDYATVRAVRTADGSCAGIGRRFGIGASQVSRIKRGLCWKNDSDYEMEEAA